MTAVQYRADEKAEDIIHGALVECDNAMQVDCAGPAVRFVVIGWFIFPKGSLHQVKDIPGAT